MKSLQESLFDSDLVSQKLPYEKLLEGRISKDDILFFIEGSYEGDFIFTNIKNPAFRMWCHDFWNKEVGDKRIGNISRVEISRIGYYTWNPKNDITREALDWLKPGKIHNKVVWNDAMYANSLDILWGFWGEKDKWNNITEWILVTEKSGVGYNTYLLVNRKEYDEIDQAVIHKLIETMAKK